MENEKKKRKFFEQGIIFIISLIMGLFGGWMSSVFFIIWGVPTNWYYFLWIFFGFFWGFLTYYSEEYSKEDNQK